MCVFTYTWSLKESVFYFHHVVGSWDGTQVIGFGSKLLYLLSHPAAKFCELSYYRLGVEMHVFIAPALQSLKQNCKFSSILRCMLTFRLAWDTK